MSTQPTISSRFNLDSLVAFRRHMHLHPETSFKEFETQKSIKKYLLELGVQESQIKICGSTGFVVDIQGTGEPQGEKKIIAFRADIDALQMTEDNPHLEYQSTNGAAHMCGHDGHTTCLLGFTALFLDNLHLIPSNKPSEEGPESGALAMIKDGCLEQVNEVYGFHNWPTHNVGHLMIKSGPVMSEVTVISLEIIGKGGHGSEPLKANDPIQAAVDFHIKLREIQKKFQGRNYVCTIPVLKGGERFNVIADKAILQGTLRSLEDGLSEEFGNLVKQALQELKQERGIQYNLDWRVYFPIVDNTVLEASHVERVAKAFFGDKNVDQGCMPVKASEDFSFYIHKVPGAFFFLGSAHKENDTMLHDCHFNFNENLIEPGSKFWLALAKDRLLA